MDSNSWEILDPPQSTQNGEIKLEAEVDSSDKDFFRQSSRYGQNVKAYE
jgi:hypothetical protein